MCADARSSKAEALGAFLHGRQQHVAELVVGLVR